MPNLAVIILTKNEEANIEEAIASASFADEILVIDSGSTDRTRELAEKQGARFITHLMDEDGFAGQRNYALTQTEAKWILYLDADERVVATAIPKIKEIVKNDIPAAYSLERKNIVMGKMMHYGGHRPDYSARLYPKAFIHWRGKVHEQLETELPMKKIDNGLYHYTYMTWKQYFSKSNYYTSLSAKSMFDKQKKISGLGVLLHGFFAFIKAYILKQGFRDGYLGLIMSILAGNAAIMKYLKLQNLYRIEREKSNL